MRIQCQEEGKYVPHGNGTWAGRIDSNGGTGFESRRTSRTTLESFAWLLVSISGNGKGAANEVTGQIGSLIQMVMATQLIGKSGVLDSIGTQTPAISSNIAKPVSAIKNKPDEGIIEINT
jgi:hypothetical protein